MNDNHCVRSEGCTVKVCVCRHRGRQNGLSGSRSVEGGVGGVGWEGGGKIHSRFLSKRKCRMESNTIPKNEGFAYPSLLCVMFT